MKLVFKNIIKDFKNKAIFKSDSTFWIKERYIEGLKNLKKLKAYIV
jgi:hypothetical protein